MKNDSNSRTATLKFVKLNLYTQILLSKHENLENQENLTNKCDFLLENAA